VHQLEALHPDKRPIIVLQIDEISLLDKLNYTTLLQLRSVFVVNGQLRTLMTGIYVPQMEDKGTSQWWNFLHDIRELKALEPSEARKLIEEPARGLFRFDLDAVEDLMVEAQREPFRIQQLCIDVLNYKYEQPRFSRVITLDDFRTAIAQSGARK
jgi:hypothetical protein